ncbi:hypothetical protein LFREDSHE_03790 [Shewanella baltica]
MTQLLKNWLTQGPFAQQLISFNHHDIVTGALFTNQVAYFYEQLLAAPEKNGCSRVIPAICLPSDYVPRC